MEPVTTTVMIGAVVGYLTRLLKDNKSIGDFFRDFTDASVTWIRPVFLEDDDAATPKKVLSNLQENPDSTARQEAVKSALAIELENNPAAETLLKDMYGRIQGAGAGIQIDNTGAKIGQQNVNATVTNTNPNFNNH